jgi:uroporphyrinogen decarboxylase
MHPFLLDHYGCACWLHYLKASEEFDFDPIILIQPWHHVKPDPVPNPIAYPLEFDYTSLPGVETSITITPGPRGSHRIRRIFQTPAGDLRDEIEILPQHSDYGIDPTPTILEPLFKEDRDLDVIPLLFPDPNKLNMVDLSEIIETVNERGLIEVQIDSAIDQRAGDLMGMTELMMASLQEPNLVQRLLRMCQEQVLKETKVVLEAGAPMIFASWFYASISAGWGPSHYKKFFLPLLKEHIALVHSYDALYHYYDDGVFMGNLETVVDAGADLISTLPGPPTGDCDLKTVKTMVGDRVCLKGNVDLLYIVKDGTPEQIEAAVEAAIHAAGHDGRYILATSDAIRDGTPVENVHAFCEAGRKFGNYQALPG